MWKNDPSSTMTIRTRLSTFYKRRCQDKYLTGRWKRWRFLSRRPAHVLLVGPGDFSVRQIHFFDGDDLFDF